MIFGAFILFGVCLKEAGISGVDSFQLAYLNTAYSLDDVVENFNFTETYKERILRDKIRRFSNF